MKKLIYSLILIIPIVLGCKTTQTSGMGPEHNDDITRLLPFAKINLDSNKILKSFDKGEILKVYDELPTEFTSPLVILTRSDYFYNNKHQESQFELIYTGVNVSNKGPAINTNDILGNPADDDIFLIARSKEIDPYLVACSNVMPIKENNYWYYYPGMYIPTQMKWLSFNPVDYQKFKIMYDHATDPDHFHSMTIFTWWSLYETKLDEYPELSVINNTAVTTQLIYYNDLPLRLLYQQGFLEYLKDEYVLGTPIYLYLQITGIDGFQKEFSCYVRDFSLISPDEIVKERIEYILEQ